MINAAASSAAVDTSSFMIKWSTYNLACNCSCPSHWAECSVKDLMACSTMTFVRGRVSEVYMQGCFFERCATLEPRTFVKLVDYQKLGVTVFSTATATIFHQAVAREVGFPGPGYIRLHSFALSRWAISPSVC